MGFWCRINRFKPNNFSHQIQSYYLGIPNGASLNSAASHVSPYVRENPYWIIPSGPSNFCSKVRFFAAPIQAQPKEKKDMSGPRLNDQITAPVIRLVTEEGHEKVSRREALERARKLKLDLVEVQRTADPPVCRLMDYHRQKYKQQLKEKDRAKSKSEVSLRKGDCKEVRFSGKTELKDLKMKAEQVKRLMERGYRVKVRAMGKEDQDLGGMLGRLSALIEDVSVVESGPSVREKEAHMIVRHVKFGTSKKGGGKKLKVVGDKSAEVHSAASVSVDSIGSIEKLSSAESGSETEEESLSDATDDFDEVVRFGDDVNGVISGSTDKKFKSAQEAASSSSHDNLSNALHPTPLPDFMQTNQVPPSPQGPPFGIENRYKRSEPRNQFPPTKPIDNRSPGMRDLLSSERQFPSQRRQPPPLDMNCSSSVPESRQSGIGASDFRNLKLPHNGMPKREPSPTGTPNAPASGYGIFSGSNAPGRQGVAAAAVHKNREGDPHDSSRNPGTRGISPNKNLPNLNSGDGQKPGLDTGGTKGWGVFSRDSSNAMPNRTSKPN